MNLNAYRIFCKLPKDIFITDGSHFRRIHRMPCFSSLDHASPSLGSVQQTKDFHFSCSVNLLPRSLSRPPTVCSGTRAERSRVLVICQRFNASNKRSNEDSTEKKSLMEAKESPYAHLSVTQKGKRTILIIIHSFLKH